MKNRAILEDRRRTLVETATEVFAEYGFDRTSVNEIAERCNWSVGALYKYVSTKDDILFLVCEEIFRHIGPDRLEVADEPDPVEKLRSALGAFIENIEGRRSQVLLMYREYAHLSPDAQRYFQAEESKVTRALARIIREGIDSGVFTCEDSELFAIECVVAAHSVALKGWALRGRTPRQVRERLIGWAIRALQRKTKG